MLTDTPGSTLNAMVTASISLYRLRVTEVSKAVDTRLTRSRTATNSCSGEAPRAAPVVPMNLSAATRTGVHEIAFAQKAIGGTFCRLLQDKGAWPNHR